MLFRFTYECIILMMFKKMTNPHLMLPYLIPIGNKMVWKGISIPIGNKMVWNCLFMSCLFMKLFVYEVACLWSCSFMKLFVHEVVCVWSCLCMKLFVHVYVCVCLRQFVCCTSSHDSILKYSIPRRWFKIKTVTEIVF